MSKRKVRREVRREQRGDDWRNLGTLLTALVNPVGAGRRISQDREVNKRYEQQKEEEDLEALYAALMSPEGDMAQEGGMGLGGISDDRGFLAKMFGNLTGENQRREEQAAAMEQIREAEAHNKQVPFNQNYNAQVELLAQLAGHAPTYSAQRPYLDQYFNMHADEYPTAMGRMEQLGQFGSMAGMGGPGGEIGELLGHGGEQAHLNELFASKFIDEFSQPTDDPNVERRNLELMARIMANPELAHQYYQPRNNPNIIQQLGAGMEGMLPGNLFGGSTYQDRIQQRQLGNTGLPTY